MAQPAKSTMPTEVLAGLVDRVTFHNSESGFCVVSTKYRCHRLCHLQMSLLDGGVGRRVGAEPAA